MKVNTYLKMVIKLPVLQHALKDKFTHNQQWYCTKHKCFITEGVDGSLECPVFMTHYHSFGKPLTEKQENEFGFGSNNDCYYHEKWIAIPTLQQLLELVTDDWELEHKYGAYYFYISKEIFDFKGKTIEEAVLKGIASKKYNQMWKGDCWKYEKN